MTTTTYRCANPEHEGLPADYCSGCAAACERELTSVRDQLMRAIGREREFVKRNAASARREAQGHMRAFAHLILPTVVNDLMAHVRPVLYRASQVKPDAARRAADSSLLAQLQGYAAMALREWDERTAGGQLAADFAADPREAEIARLREVITDHGQQLHKTYAPPSNGFNPCNCAGCNLIRAMDTDGLPGPSEAASDGR